MSVIRFAHEAINLYKLAHTGSINVKVGPGVGTRNVLSDQVAVIIEQSWLSVGERPGDLPDGGGRCVWVRWTSERLPKLRSVGGGAQHSKAVG